MTKSMTGFSSLAHEDELAKIIVTIRGFNHRYLDVQLKLPPQLHGEAGNLRAHVQRRIGRGRDNRCHTRPRTPEKEAVATR